MCDETMRKATAAVAAAIEARDLVVPLDTSIDDKWERMYFAAKRRIRHWSYAKSCPHAAAIVEAIMGYRPAYMQGV